MISYKKKQQSKLHLISENAAKEIDLWVKKYPEGEKQSAVMSALRIVQDENRGYLTEELMDAVAEYLEMQPIAVYEVATFYTMYELEPVGKHKISICTNISCMLCGSDSIVDHITKKLGIKFGESTLDGRFTLKEAECLGACVNAPMLQIGDKYYENLTTKKVDQILDTLD